MGNTIEVVEVETKNPVHPHACGEHGNFKKTFNLLIGSSPRLWGTRIIALLDLIQHRFIPTPVGNTSRRDFKSLVVSVHPHACGEHVMQAEGISKGIGSSPRLWGTLGLHHQTAGGVRFIPTPVGNTLAADALTLIALVHPHACGEHTTARSAKSAPTGSSPRLWGTQHHTTTQ